MKICPNCHVLCENECPICGRTKHLNQVEAGEPVLLMTLTAMKTMLVEPILEDSGIPYSRMGTRGSAIVIYGGAMVETYRFYVPYAAYEKARALVEEVFGEDDEIMSSITEFDIKDNDEGE